MWKLEQSVVLLNVFGAGSKSEFCFECVLEACSAVSIQNNCAAPFGLTFALGSSFHFSPLHEERPLNLLKESLIVLIGLNSCIGRRAYSHGDAVRSL